MKKILLSVLFMLLTISSLSYAIPNEDTVKALKLTKNQVERINRIRKEAQKLRKELHKEINKVEVELKKELNKANPNQKRIQKLTKEMKRLQSKRIEQRVGQYLVMKKIMSHKQFQKMQKLRTKSQFKTSEKFRRSRPEHRLGNPAGKNGGSANQDQNRDDSTGRSQKGR